MSPTDENTPLEALADLATDPEPSEYDQRLGREIGQDAIRVWNGDLSEATFNERYDHRLREEFGDEYVPPGVNGDE